MMFTLPVVVFTCHNNTYEIKAPLVVSAPLGSQCVQRNLRGKVVRIKGTLVVIAPLG